MAVNIAKFKSLSTSTQKTSKKTVDIDKFKALSASNKTEEKPAEYYTPPETFESQQDYADWRSTIESTPQKLESNLKQIDKDISYWKERQKAYETVANTEKDPTVVAEFRKLYDDATTKLTALEQSKAITEEERQWSEYFTYSPESLSQNSDWDELSKYISTANGREAVKNATIGYGETGYNDIMYDYINRNEDAIAKQNVIDTALNRSVLGIDDSFLKQMTDDEIATFNYLYALDEKAGDKEHKKAYEFINYIKSDLTYLQRKQQAEQWSQYAKESPVAASVFSTLMAPAKLISTAGQFADYGATGEVDPNAGYNKFSQIPSDIRSEVGKNIESKWGKVGSFLYETGMSMADFLFNTAVSGGNSTVAQTIMGTGAAADTTLDALNRGVDSKRALWLGAVAGAAEAFTERVSLEALLGKTQWSKTAVGYLLSNVLSEGTEEMASELINTIADIIISKDKSYWQAAINAYKAEGLSEEEAFRKALVEKAKEIGLAGLGGALSGGAIGSVGAITGAYNSFAAEPEIDITQPNVPSVVEPMQDPVQAAVVEALDKAAGNQTVATQPTQTTTAPAYTTVLPRAGETLPTVKGKINSPIAERENSEYTMLNKSLGTEVESFEKQGEYANSSRGEGRQYSLAQRGSDSLVAGRTEIARTERPRSDQAQRAVAIRDTAKTARLVSQSTASLGISTGTDTKRVTVIPRSFWTEDMKKLSREQANKGRSVTYFVGSLELNEKGETFTARGAVSPDGKQIWIRADHSALTIEQIAKHEEYHVAVKKDHSLNKRLKEKLIQKHGDGWDVFLSTAYTAKYFTDKDGNVTADADYILEEILADIYADIDDLDYMDNVPVRTTDLTEDAQETVREVDEKGDAASANTEFKTSRELELRGERKNKPNTSVEWHLFNRSFANKTSDLKEGTTRTISINTANHIYFVTADGYMQGFAEKKVHHRYKNKIQELRRLYGESNAGGANLDSLAESYESVRRQRSEHNSGFANNGATGYVGGISVGSQESNGAGHLEGDDSHSGYNGQTDDEEIYDEGDEVPGSLVYDGSGNSYQVGENGEHFLFSRESDSDYLAAVNRGDMETAQKMVDEAAKAAGYTAKAYHGTQQFGFTSFNPAKSDDHISLFFTDDVRVASTYVGRVAKVKQISDIQNSPSFKYERGKKYTREEILQAHNFIQSIPQYHVYGGEPTINLEKQTIYHAGSRMSVKQLMEFAEGIAKSGIYSVYINPKDFLEVDAQENNWASIPFLTKYAIEDERLAAEINVLLEERNAIEKKYRAEHVDNSEVEPWERKRIEDVYPRVAEIRKLLDNLEDKRDAIYNKHRKTYIGTRELAKYAKEEGYKGVAISNLYDGGGKNVFKENMVPSTVFIVFDSEQIKSADPVTYDDNGNVVPLSERFNKKNEDIRFSREARDVEDLREQNETLRENLDYWKGQVKRTTSDTVTLRKNDIDKLAKRLLKSYDSTLNTEDVSGDIKALGEYIIRNGDGKNELTWTEVKDRAVRIAQNVVQNASALVDNTDGEYKLIKNAIKKYKLFYVDKGDIVNYKDFRKKNRNRITLTTDSTNIGVDVAYMQLQDEFGKGWFPDEYINPSDQLLHMSNLLDSLEPVYENPFSYNMAVAVEYVANDIVDSLLSESVRQTPPTFADKQAMKLDAQKAKDREKLDKLREQKNARIAEIRKQGVKKTQEALRKVRADRDAKIKELQEGYRERNKRASESRKATALRARIMRHVKKLSSTLLRPSDKHHIPDALQKPLAALLEAINLESNYEIEYGKDAKYHNVEPGSSRYAEPTKRTQAFAKLKEAYAKLAGEMVIDPDLLGGDGVVGLFDEVLAMADKRIADMNPTELETIWQAVRAIEASIRSTNKMFAAGRFATVADAADALRQENKNKTQKTELDGPFGALGKMQKLVSVDMLTPEAFFHRLGKAGDALFRMMRNAQDEHIRIMKAISDFTHETLGKVDVNALEKEMHTVSLGGEEVSLSTAQLMELYVLMRREQARAHILVGGILPDAVSKGGLKKITKAEPIRGIMLDSIVKATSLLSAEQIKIADALQKYASTDLSEYGNKASMQVYNYKKFTEENYWPIRSNRQETKSTVEGDTASTSVANKGFTKATKPNANTSVKIGSIFDTFSTHASEMATYAAWLATSEDINRIRNFTFRDGEGNRVGTVKGLFDRVHGSQGSAYVQKLLSDIANGVKGTHAETEYMSGIVGNYKAASVGANLRVIIQQPTAILRALDMIEPQYLAASVRKGGWEKALKYAPIAQWKDWGYFDINTGRQMKDVLFESDSKLGKVKQASMWAAGKMDSLSWGMLWNAVEAETKAKHKDLKPGTEEFYKAVAERFTEVVDRTQVVDGILQRSQIMRSSSGLTKMATSFMGEPTKQFNMFLSSIYDVRNSTNAETRKAAKKRLARTTTALLVSGVVNAAAQSIIDALRDDDKEKDYWEKWLAAFTGFTGEEDSFGEYFAAFWNGNVGSIINPAQYIPYAKDVISLLQGYDVARMDMESVAKTITAAQNFIKAFRGGKQTVHGAMLNLLLEASRMLGIPLSNLKRDIWSIAKLGADSTDNYLLQYNMEKFWSNVEYSGNRKVFMDILYKAYEAGASEWQTIYDDLLDSGASEETIKNAVESRMKKAQGVKSVKDLDERFEAD